MRILGTPDPAHEAAATQHPWLYSGVGGWTLIVAGGVAWCSAERFAAPGVLAIVISVPALGALVWWLAARGGSELPGAPKVLASFFPSSSVCRYDEARELAAMANRRQVSPTGPLSRITIDPEQCGGRPCVRGMRIRVSDVIDLLAAGLTAAQIVDELPDLELDDIPACLQYASRRLNYPTLVA